VTPRSSSSRSSTSGGACSRLFPGGDLSAVPGVLRLRVRTRLLVIFVMLSVIPLSVLGVLATRAPPRCRARIRARATDRRETCWPHRLHRGGSAPWPDRLSLYVAGSVAGPLGQLQGAMRDVEQGDLETRCPS